MFAILARLVSGPFLGTGPVFLSENTTKIAVSAFWGTPKKMHV